MLSTFPARAVMQRWFARPPLWCTLIVCGLILAVRRPDAFQLPQFWAEDGSVFFLQSRTLGAAALIEQSAGYLHTVLRIIAWLASWTDPTLSPAIYVVVAGLITLYVAARTQSARFPLAPSFGYALAVVMVPDAFEVLLNLTNLQWVLAAGLVLVMISNDPQRAGQRAHDIIATVLFGLTGPFVIVLLPLFVMRALHRRTRFSKGLAAVAAFCSAIQGFTILRHPMEVTIAPVAFETLLSIPGARIAGSLLTGGRVGASSPAALTAILGMVALAAVFAVGLRRGPRRAERMWLVLSFVGFLTIALYRCRYVLPAVYFGAGSRYFFPLQLIALWLIIEAAVAAQPMVARYARLALMLIALLNLPRLREPAFTDLEWSEYASAIRRGEEVIVPTNPSWEFKMPGNSTIARARRTVPRTALVNVSTRCWISPAQPAVVGFALHEGQPRKLLVRIIGPSLAKFGVKTPIARPKATLMLNAREEPTFVAKRDPASDATIKAATDLCRAFALEPGFADLAGIAVLGPGIYSLVISSEADASGEVLVEIYEIPPEPRLEK